MRAGCIKRPLYNMQFSLLILATLYVGFSFAYILIIIVLNKNYTHDID